MTKRFLANVRDAGTEYCWLTRILHLVPRVSHVSILLVHHLPEWSFTAQHTNWHAQHQMISAV